MISIQNYARACGPAVVAAFTHWTREEAAAKLHEIERMQGRRRSASTHVRSIHTALAAAGYDVRLDAPKRRITLTRWLRENPNFTGVVLAAHHFVAIAAGIVVEDNKVPVRRGLVRRVLAVAEAGALAGAAEPAPAAEPETERPTPPAVQRLVDLAHRHGRDVTWTSETTVSLRGTYLDLEITWTPTATGRHRVVTRLDGRYVAQKTAKILIASSGS